MKLHIFFNEKLGTLWAVNQAGDFEVRERNGVLTMPAIPKEKRDRIGYIAWRRFEGYTELCEMDVEQSAIIYTMKTIQAVFRELFWHKVVFNDKPGAFSFEERRDVLVGIAASELEHPAIRSVREWLSANPSEEELARTFPIIGNKCFF